MNERTAVAQLTVKETALLTAIQEGMDEPGCGWLHELTSESSRSFAGVLGSLVKKGLVTIQWEDDCCWVQLSAG